MKLIEQQSKIREWLDDLKAIFPESELAQMFCFRQFIVTGSFADWIKNPQGASCPSWNAIPDVNLYFLISATEKQQAEAEYKLGLLYKEMMTRHDDINILLDLHPFSRSIGKVNPDMLNLQLTSRILNMNNMATYPNYCWYGWKSNYHTIYSRSLDRDYLKSLEVPQPERDLNWLNYMRMAFASYSNVMHMIALSVAYIDPVEVYDEAFRYLKEILKDGISLGMPILDGVPFDYSVIKEWKDRSAEFYASHYGDKEAFIVRRLLSVEKNYFRFRDETNARRLLGDFFTLKNAIFDKSFKQRFIELALSQDGSAKQDPPYSPLPMWY